MSTAGPASGGRGSARARSRDGSAAAAGRPSGGSAATSASARASQLLASLSATWKERATREPATLHASLASTITSVLALAKRVPDRALLAHADTVLEALETALPWSPTPAPPQRSSNTETASSPSAFAPSPHLLVLLLKLLMLQAQRIPALYHRAWEQAAASSDAAASSLPAELSVSSFFSFYRRVRRLSQRLLDGCVAPDSAPTFGDASVSTPWPGWTPQIAARAFHVHVLALFHAPEDAETAALGETSETAADAPAAASPLQAFWPLLEHLLRSARFVDALLYRYSADLGDVLAHLPALINHRRDEKFSSHMTLTLLRAWRQAPLRQTARTAPAHSPTSPPAAGASTPLAPAHHWAHDTRCVVQSHAPPPLSTHEALRSFLTLQTDFLRSSGSSSSSHEERGEGATPNLSLIHI